MAVLDSKSLLYPSGKVRVFFKYLKYLKFKIWNNNIITIIIEIFVSRHDRI